MPVLQVGCDAGKPHSFRDTTLRCEASPVRRTHALLTLVNTVSRRSRHRTYRSYNGSGNHAVKNAGPPSAAFRSDILLDNQPLASWSSKAFCPKSCLSAQQQLPQAEGNDARKRRDWPPSVARRAGTRRRDRA
ncbi:hypothetical protein KCP76_14630 [Salmonella enterica subsp. enterica serovar Weltevreden]|nr:hypothetical protein KCP76_14630 [Salmonella enterica subsp. enterica serovar Weltevreden]